MSSEPVGTLAEEAAKLIAVMQGWASEHGGPQPARERADRAGRSEGGHTPGDNEPGHPVRDTAFGADRDATHAAHDPALECRWCPLCQAVRVAKATTPEVREHLASAALSLAMAFKGLMENVEQSSSRATPVEKIDLDGEPDLDSPED